MKEHRCVDDYKIYKEKDKFYLENLFDGDILVNFCPFCGVRLT